MSGFLFQRRICSLNESPSEKEGKSGGGGGQLTIHLSPSMKVPPKRKGNNRNVPASPCFLCALNESPSEKEGKCCS